MTIKNFFEMLLSSYKSSLARHDLKMPEEYDEIINEIRKRIDQELVKVDDKFIEKQAEKLLKIFNNWIKAYKGILPPVSAKDIEPKYLIAEMLREIKIIK